MTTARNAILASTLILFGAGNAALAQDSTRTWSLGVDNQSGVYVGIAVSPTFRLEPEVGVVRSRDKAVITIDNGFGTVSVFNDEVTSASYRVGLGLLWQWQRVAQLRFYAGPRFGVIHATASEKVSGAQTGDGSVSRTDWFLAGSFSLRSAPMSVNSLGRLVGRRRVARRRSTPRDTLAVRLRADS